MIIISVENVQINAAESLPQTITDEADQTRCAASLKKKYIFMARWQKLSRSGESPICSFQYKRDFDTSDKRLLFKSMSL